MRLERSESLRAQEEQKKVHHRNYDIVSDQEDVIQGPQYEDPRHRKPEALEPHGEGGIGLPDEGERERQGRQGRADRLETGTSGERGEGDKTHTHDQAPVQEIEAHPALLFTPLVPERKDGAPPGLSAGMM